jgi:hypothetical protein
MTYKILLFKNSSFEQEEEYRIILKIEGTASSVIQYRIFEDAFIPYVEIGSEHCLPITSITLGPKLNLDIAVKGLRLFLASKNYKVGNKEEFVKIYKSKIPLRY